MNTYAIGQLVRCPAAFTNAAGAAADPTAVTFGFRTPAGVVTTYTYGVGSEVVKDSVGNYHVDLTASAAGVWTWEFDGTGAVTASMPSGEFEVRGSLLDTSRTVLASVADFKATYDSAPPATDDSRIEWALASASAMLIAAVGWDFGRHPMTGTEVNLADGRGGTRLCVHSGIVSVTLVEVRSSASDTWQSLAAADWQLEPYAPLPGEPYDHIRLTGVGSWSTWPKGVATVRWTGVRGWPAISAMARRAGVALARQLYRSDATNPGGILGPDELAGGVYPRGWPDDAYRLLDHYRHLNMGCYV